MRGRLPNYNAPLEILDDGRLHAEVTGKNRAPILDILRRVLPPSGLVLEVAAGTGEHAVHFASLLPALTWRPSDPDPKMRTSIAARAADAGLANLEAPLDLDVRAGTWPLAAADAVVSINMIHIAPWTATVGLMKGAGRILSSGGVLYLYGPYRVGGRHTAPSNAAFDDDLRRRDPEWGVRDLDRVADEAKAAGLTLAETVEMPNNNLSVVFGKG